jgi:hypothetical protein
VTNRSRSRDGRVDGAKCSLRRTLCFMILRRLRTDSTRDSADPETVRGCEALLDRNIKWKAKRNDGMINHFSKVPRSPDQCHRGISKASTTCR